MYGSSSAWKRSAVKRWLKCPRVGGKRGPGPAARPCGGAGFSPPAVAGLRSRPPRNRRRAAAAPAAEGARRWRQNGLGAVKPPPEGGRVEWGAAVRGANGRPRRASGLFRGLEHAWKCRPGGCE